MTKEEEMRVIQAVLDGDTARFEDLVRAHEKGVYNLCLRLTGNEQDALDASQDAFFKAYRALGSFRGESRFSVWLYRLASNACMDILRKRPPAPEAALWDEEGQALPLPDSGPSPQEIAERRELRRAVARALDTLSPDHREALVLREVSGLSYEEIASVTGLEPGTVKSRIFRARKHLASALMADGNFSGYGPSKKTKNKAKEVSQA